MSTRSSLSLWVVIAALAPGACKSDGPKVVAPDRPTILGDQCSIEDEQSAPLIVDWSTSARSRLEAAVLRGGVVAVAVSECDIEPLWQCESAARYAYASATSRRESERISDRASLFARIPVSAVSLSADIDAGADLSVDKTTVGRFETDTRALAQADLTGDCEGATHFVSAVDVGAFEFTKSRSASMSAEAKSGAVGAGGAASTDREMLSADGDLARCAEAAAGQAQPPDGCGAPIQVELTPLLPSLDIAQWQELALATTQRVMQECHPHGTGTAEMWLIIEPSGRVRVATGQLPFPSNGNLDACIKDIWNAAELPSFSGPALVTRAYIYVYPPAEQDAFTSTIEQQVRDLVPGIPPRALGDELGYAWDEHGVTPTDEWQ